MCYQKRKRTIWFSFECPRHPPGHAHVTRARNRLRTPVPNRAHASRAYRSSPVPVVVETSAWFVAGVGGAILNGLFFRAGGRDV